MNKSVIGVIGGLVVLGIVIILMFFVFKEDAWDTEYGREFSSNFIRECNGASGGMNEYCQCSLDKVMDEWPDPKDIDEFDEATYIKILGYGIECLDELGLDSLY